MLTALFDRTRNVVSTNFLELTDEVDECQNQIRVQAKKVRSKLKRFKKENDARIEADSEISGSFLDRCSRQSLLMECTLLKLHS